MRGFILKFSLALPVSPTVCQYPAPWRSRYRRRKRLFQNTSPWRRFNGLPVFCCAVNGKAMMGRPLLTPPMAK